MGAANVKVIHAHEFVRARPGGVLDLETSEALLLEIAKAADGLDRAEVLIDTRQADSQLGAADPWFGSTGRASSRCLPTARDSRSQRSRPTRRQ